MRYTNLNKFLFDKFGEKIQKICIDGGFTCPNRDGTIGTGGCIFCGRRGAGEHTVRGKPIRDQIKDHYLKDPKPKKFAACFQNFTNTYAPIDVLKRRYDEALEDQNVAVLAIETRPDCINEDVCRLLASYRDRCYIWVELGLQTSNDGTAKLINRGYTSKVFTEAVHLLNRYGIDIVVHMIIGLPGEDMDDVKETVRFINRHDIRGIKIHSLYIKKDTQLEDMYASGGYVPIDIEDYVEGCVYVLTHISPDMVVHRIKGDCPPSLLIAPSWVRDKNTVINMINSTMEKNNLRQGCFYGCY